MPRKLTEPPDLQVVVAGFSGSGKSTVAREVTALLESLGLEVQLSDEPLRQSFEENQPRRVQALKDRGTRVLVRTLAMSREPLKKEG